MSSLRSAFFLFAGLCLTGALKAYAQTARTARFSYVRHPGAEGCPDEDSVRRAVSARLGREAFHDDAELLVQAVVERASPGLLARVSLSDRAGRTLGKRDIASPVNDCRELASAMELAISVAIDPVAAMRVAPPVPVPPPPAPPPPVVQAEPAPPPPRGIDLGLSAWVSAGDAPALSPGLSIDARYRWRIASLGLEAGAGFPTSSPASIGRVVSSRLLASVVPCLHHRAFFGCAKASAGALTVAGDGLDEARAVSTFYAALGARAGAELSLHSSFALRAYVEALAPLARISVRVGNDAVWSTPTFAGAAGLGGFFRF
ncbi:MAG: hypothetical protein ACOZIN_16505 [Myxococcota bacterium]